MKLLAAVPGRARFQLAYADLRELPIRLRNAMLDRVDDWRAREDSPTGKQAGDDAG